MIKQLIAREILDSRGNPTVEIELKTEHGSFFGSAPSGASKGSHEVPELRDRIRYLGMGVRHAVELAEKTELKGMDETRQIDIDNMLMQMKPAVFSNITTPVSIAVCRAGAAASNMELWKYISKLAGAKPRMPVPYMNIINGGRHGNNELRIQEFLIIPKTRDFSEAVEQCANVYHVLKMMIKKQFHLSGVGDEGGFVCSIDKTTDALNIIEKAVDELGYDIDVGMDAAASNFFSGSYDIDGKTLDSDELMEYYLELAGKYHIKSIEDPFHENDWKSFSELVKRFKGQVVGDDILVSNVSRVNKAIAKKSCNALLLKINQVGTLSGALNAFNAAKKAKWNVIVSHRSGETTDDFIADMSVGLGADIKAGAPARGERVVKYNRLMRINEEF